MTRKTLKTSKPEDWFELVLPPRKAGVLRGLAPGMAREQVLAVEGKRGLDHAASSAEETTWRRQIVPYDQEGNAARESVVAEFVDDALVALYYELHLGGPLADSLITAATKLVVTRLQEALGKGVKRGREVEFSLTTPVPARLRVHQSKHSRYGDTYSNLRLTLDAR